MRERVVLKNPDGAPERCTLSALVWAQQPELPVADLCTLQGRVVDAVTGTVMLDTPIKPVVDSSGADVARRTPPHGAERAQR